MNACTDVRTQPMFFCNPCQLHFFCVVLSRCALERLDGGRQAGMPGTVLSVSEGGGALRAGSARVGGGNNGVFVLCATRACVCMCYVCRPVTRVGPVTICRYSLYVSVLVSLCSSFLALSVCLSVGLSVSLSLSRGHSGEGQAVATAMQASCNCHDPDS